MNRTLLNPALRDAGVIVVVGCLVLLTNLGAVSLWDYDEALWGSTTAEMARRGDWIVPWHNEEVSTHKPPLMFWVMLVGSRLCGETEFGFRIGSAICGMLTALVVRQLGCLLFCRAVGLLAGIATVTAINLVVVARAANPDIELTLLATVALLVFVRCGGVAGWPPRGSFRPLPWAAAAGLYAVLGLAVLTKGPLGVAIPAAALGLFVWWHDLQAVGESLAGRSLGGRFVAVVRQGLAAARALRPLFGLAVVLLVAGPWYVLVQQRSGGAFGADFIGIHHVKRFLEPMEGHRGPVFYYLPALLIGMFPWSMFAIPTALDTVRRLRGPQPDRSAAMLLTAWLATWIGIFSLAQTKLPNYILPAYPAAALLVAAFLVSWTRDPAGVGRRWMPIALWLLLAIAAIAAGGCLAAPAIRIGGRDLLEMATAAPVVADVLRLTAWSGAILAAGACGCLILAARDLRGATVATFVGMAVVLAVFLFGFVSVAAGRHQPARDLVRIMQEHGATPTTPLGQHHYSQPSLVLYGGRRVERCGDRAACVEFFRTSPDGMLVMRVRDAGEIAGSLPPGTEIIGRVDDFPKRSTLFVVRRTASAP